QERNAEIRRRAETGERLTDIAAAYGISRQRVEQIVHVNRQRAREQAAELIPTQPHCERCGRESKHIERHHPDYRDPRRVELLCLRCHPTADRERDEAEARREFRLSGTVRPVTRREAAQLVGLTTHDIRRSISAGEL